MMTTKQSNGTGSGRDTGDFRLGSQGTFGRDMKDEKN